MSAGSKSLADRAGFLIAANVIKFGIGIVMPMILVRMLTHADYGSYQQMVLVGSAATGLLTLGLPTSVFYFNSHVGRDRVPLLVVQTSLLLILGGAMAASGIYFGAAHLSRMMNNPGAGPLLATYGLSVGFVIASEHSISFLISQNRYATAVMFEVGEAAVRIVLLVAPLVLGYGFSGLVICIVLYSLLRFVVRSLYLFGASELDFRPMFRRPRGWFVREQLNYSIPIAMISLVAMLGNTLNRGILAASITPADYAVFAVGNTVLPFATIFQTAVSNVLRAEMPALVREGRLAEFADVVSASVRKLSIIVLPSFVFLLANSYDFITTLYTSSYAQSVNVFRICVFDLPLDMLILSAVPQIFGVTRVNMYVNFAATAFLIVASVLLIHSMGFYGAALAGVATQYFAVLLYLVVVLRLMRVRIGKLFPFAHLVRVGVSACVAALVSRMLPSVSEIGLANLMAAACVYSVVFFGVAIPLGVFTQDEWRLAKRWLGKMDPSARLGWRANK